MWEARRGEVIDTISATGMRRGAMDDEHDDRRYAVVVNEEEQFSIWALDGDPIPAGWVATGFSGTREQCLDHIAEVWTDMRPRSLRIRMDGVEQARR